MSIEEKIGSYLRSKKGQAKILNSVKSGANSSGGGLTAMVGFQPQADAFASDLTQAIQQHVPSFTSDAIKISNPKIITDKSMGTIAVQIDISFDAKKVSRPSLDPEDYPSGVDNIVRLMNNGWRTHRLEDKDGDPNGPRARVHGTWPNHGDNWYSRPMHPQTHFIQDVVARFIQSVSGKFPIRIDVNVSYSAPRTFRNETLTMRKK